MVTPEGIKAMRKRKKIISFIIEYTQQHGYRPSEREIAENIGLQSMNSVRKHIEVLKRQGALKYDDA
ncbi:repressor LexA [Anaerosporobacter mobilis DSM 15930]|jgi:repressor LexA|uniref:Repressor LexA n=1 Tax=Anaerosporobacter mobilis DSM 15930 TaxID=1120996 RepID=A0A1M7LH68_9FIRM|nr:hypothetical protein [Anaerosporobacter mobilis]SHM77391.1 repressor LexA [Anaerosporobacter mobilis DSM 15930]